MNLLLFLGQSWPVLAGLFPREKALYTASELLISARLKIIRSSSLVTKSHLDVDFSVQVKLISVLFLICRLLSIRLNLGALTTERDLLLLETNLYIFGVLDLKNSKIKFEKKIEKLPQKQ